MKTATKFHSDFFNTDCLILDDGQIVFSLTGATKLITNTDNQASIKALRTVAEQSGGPQPSMIARLLGDSGTVFAVLVDNGHMKQEAQAISQDTFIDVLKVYSQKDTKGGENARKLLYGLAGMSLKLILEKEAGVLDEQTSSVIDENIAIFFKGEATKEKADAIQELKELLKLNGQKDRTQTMGRLINDFIYNRLPKEVNEALTKRAGAYRSYGSHTKWQHLSPKTQARIEEILVVATMMIKREMRDGQIFNFSEIIQDLDEVMPRYRASYAPIA